ncbi:putative dioxygenase of extradiol dioxygenase family [Opitutaceae bacterium TAV1]|nr:glyoxalase [Opitutaceae bacterium TAV5]EIP99383.1 putative dioxygenase of extradiol dioxygenase family [Opitutaceae bacterium TAV1]
MSTTTETPQPSVTPSFRAIEYAFTVNPITDVARARKFYEEILGLKTGSIWEDAQFSWIEYDLGAHTLAITKSDPDWKPGSGPAIALEVEDYPAAIAHLRAHNVKFIIEPTESPVCRMAVVADPDGNGIIIHKRNAHTH